jgi:phosphoribosyl 1,2-cyclic phosphate phosphodiesterase
MLFPTFSAIFCMAIELTFLGTGTSHGVPIIGCDCEVCRSTDRRDKRMRTSAVVSLDGHNVLIDTAPELRMQCLQNDIRRMEACLITHTHADHIFGMDDLRRFNQIQGNSIDLYASAEHLVTLNKVFGYALAERAGDNPDVPHLIFNTIVPGDSFSLFGHEVKPLLLPHGHENVTGYRIGRLAYCTDISGMPEAAAEELADLNVLVLGALRPKPHPKHLSIDQAIEVAERIGAKRTYFVHVTHQVSHRECEKYLPNNIELAYDTLRIVVSE